jgi:hypothetical protein
MSEDHGVWDYDGKDHKAGEGKKHTVHTDPDSEIVGG